MLLSNSVVFRAKKLEFTTWEEFCLDFAMDLIAIEKAWFPHVVTPYLKHKPGALILIHK